MMLTWTTMVTKGGGLMRQSLEKRARHKKWQWLAHAELFRFAFFALFLYSVLTDHGNSKTEQQR